MKTTCSSASSDPGVDDSGHSGRIRSRVGPVRNIPRTDPTVDTRSRTNRSRAPPRSARSVSVDGSNARV